MADLNVIYRIAADISGLQDGVPKAVALTDGLEKKFESLGRAIIGAFSVHQIKHFVSETTTAFGEEEAASNRLLTALKAQGTFTPELARQYADLAAQYQKTTVFSDDLITSQQALLVQVGNVMPGQMNAALEAATNLSAGLGIGLEQATTAVAKAFEGGGSAITRMLPSLKDVVKEGAPVEEVLARINEKFNGQATGQIETYDGKMKQLNNSLNDAQERMGKVVAQGLTPMLDLFEKLPAPIQTAGAAIYTLSPNLEGVALALLAIGGPGKALALFTGAWATMGTFMTGTILPLLSTALPYALRGLAAFFSVPAGLIIAGILAVVAVWKNWDTIGPIVKGVYDAVKKFLVDNMGEILRIGGPVLSPLKLVYDTFQNWEKITAFVEGVYTSVKKWLGDNLVHLLVAGGPVLAPILLVYTTFKNWDKIATIAENVYKAVKTWLVDKFEAVVRSIREKVAAVSGFFKDMYDKVVGRSYVPDLLEGIRREFARLPSVMVDPARINTERVTLNFRQMGQNVLDVTRSALSQLPHIFDDGFGGVLGRLKSIGQSLLSGIIDAILQPIMDYISGWVNKAIGLLMSVFGFGGQALGAGGFGLGTSGAGSTSGMIGGTTAGQTAGSVVGGIAGGAILGFMAATIIGDIRAGNTGYEPPSGWIGPPDEFGNPTYVEPGSAFAGHGGVTVPDLDDRFLGRTDVDPFGNPIGTQSYGDGPYDWRRFNPEDFPGFAEGSGGIRDFRDGTLAMLHGQEGVFTKSQWDAQRTGQHDTAILAKLEAIRDAILSRAAVAVQIDGREVARATVKAWDNGGAFLTEAREVLGVP